MKTTRKARLSFISAGALQSLDYVSLESCDGPIGTIEDVSREGDTITLRIGGEKFNRDARDPVALIKPRELKADPNVPHQTPWAITLLNLLEVVNNAGGLIEDDNGNFDVVDELEQGWPDLADATYNAYTLLAEQNNPYATLVINRF
jgi:hypothetical protein